MVASVNVQPIHTAAEPGRDVLDCYFVNCLPCYVQKLAELEPVTHELFCYGRSCRRLIRKNVRYVLVVKVHVTIVNYLIHQHLHLDPSGGSLLIVEHRQLHALCKSWEDLEYVPKQARDQNNTVLYFAFISVIFDGSGFIR